VKVDSVLNNEDVTNTVSFEKIVKVLSSSDADTNGRISADEFRKFMEMVIKVEGGDILVNSIECTSTATED
jgi:hypothetical protein